MGFLNSSWGKGQPTQPVWHSVLLYETLFNFLLAGHWFIFHGPVAVMSFVWNEVVMCGIAHQWGRQGTGITEIVLFLFLYK